MIGALIGDLATWTYEHEQDTFWKHLVPDGGRGAEPSVYGHALMRAASKNVLNVPMQDVSFIRTSSEWSPKERLSLSGQWLMWQLMCAWNDGKITPIGMAESPSMEKEDGYARMFVINLIRALRKGKTKSEAYHSEQCFKDLSKHWNWRPWMKTDICQALKELRKRIAEANDIPFEIEECTHKGDCPGTCPKCEADVRYLMECIDMREQEGKPVVIEGLMNEDELRKAFSIDSVEQDIPENPDDFVTMGMPEPPKPEVLMGDIAAPLEGQEMLAPSYDFAATIAKELLSNTDGNIIFSPAGLCRILEMLREGMDENSDIYDKVCCLIDGFNSEIETWDIEDFKLEHAASIWYNKALGVIKEEYLDTLEDAYNAEARNADFSQKTKTKLWIDKWVSDNTNKMIKSLDTEISTDSLLVLLDAIYMNGKWENPFDPDLTEADTFYNVDDTEAEVDMMYQELEDADYAETDEYQVINIPYKNFDFCMTVVLPKNGVSIDSIMERTDWLDVDSDFCNVDLFMPRFKFDNTLSFKDILKGLGLSDLFEKEDSLPGITDLPAHISEIKQQCVIAVEEEGTEAAAVTMAECEVGCLPPDDIPQTITMMLDRPFGFAIKGEYNQIVFMGVVRNMGQKKD